MLSWYLHVLRPGPSCCQLRVSTRRSTKASQPSLVADTSLLLVAGQNTRSWKDRFSLTDIWKLPGCCHGHYPHTQVQKKRWKPHSRGCRFVKSTHQVCETTDTIAWHPTRLLDISRLASDRIVKLVEGEGIPPGAHYTTLSHSWSQAQFLQLTESTKAHLDGGVALGQLPQSFQDAMQMTLAMGIHFIWIDSLCIQQDDLEDWQREARQMHRVYSAAHCNIAATAGMSWLLTLILEYVKGLLERLWMRKAITLSLLC